MTCIDCGAQIPSFALRCTECRKKHNKAKEQPRIRVSFNPIEINPDRTYTNMTTESPDCDE